MSLTAISVPPQTGAAPQGLLVLLHGWGANAEDVAAIATVLNLSEYQLLFPNGPFAYPYAATGRAWYNFPADFTFTGRPNLSHHPELLASRQQLREWLQSLEGSTGVPLSRTVLGGFSQGGAMTLDVGLDLPLAGLVVLSGYLHAPPQTTQTTLPKVLMAHGTQDLVVPISAARQARESLLAMGVDLDYRELPMGHEISLRIVELVQNFTEEIRLHPQETA